MSTESQELPELPESPEPKEVGPDDRPSVVRLARHGTLLARSSDFTRGKAILHTTEVEIGLEGAHDEGGAIHETTAGVGFVSAQTRLDRIFQKDMDKASSTKSSTAPKPPPPPPLPRPRPNATAKQAIATNGKRPPTLHSASSVSKAPATHRSAPNDGPNTFTTPAAQAPSSFVGTAPPLQGMYVRQPTRHRKLIKTKLSDLPQDLQEQDPQIRGGVAVYKVSDPAQRTKYGATVEINASDYIERMKEKISDLERQLSVLRGMLENGKRGGMFASKQTNSRSPIRMTTFMNKRSKEPDTGGPDNAGKGVSRGKTLAGFRKDSDETGAAKNSNNSGKQNPHATETKPPRAPTAAVNFPNGFGFGPEPPPRKPQKAPDSVPKRLNAEQNVSIPQGKVNIPAAFGGQAMRRTSQEQQNASNLTSHSGNNSDSASYQLGRRGTGSSSTDSEILPERRQLSEPHSTTAYQQQLSPISRELTRTWQPRKNPPGGSGDRNAAPMPAIERKEKSGAVGRTHSFNGNVGGSFVKRGAYDDGTVSRAFSLHRESNASPPPRKPEKKSTSKATSKTASKAASKKSRGVRKLLGLR